MTGHSLRGHYRPCYLAFLSSPSSDASSTMLASSPSPRHNRHSSLIPFSGVVLIPVSYFVASIYICNPFSCWPTHWRQCLGLVSQPILCSSISFTMPRTLLNLPPDVLFCILTRDEIELVDILRLSLVSRTNWPLRPPARPPCLPTCDSALF